jgi:hypothetical protein
MLQTFYQNNGTVGREKHWPGHVWQMSLWCPGPMRHTMALYCEARRPEAPKPIHPEGLRALALAVLQQAVIDAACPAKNQIGKMYKEGARLWLLSEGEHYFRAAGMGAEVDREDLEKWIAGGCKTGVHYVREPTIRPKKNNPGHEPPPTEKYLEEMEITSPKRDGLQKRRM